MATSKDRAIHQNEEKDCDYRDLQASWLKAMAHPIRLQILEELLDQARCVKDLRELVDAPQPVVSQHLAQLKTSGLVASHSNGPLRCYYLLEPSLVRSLLGILPHERQPVVRDREEVIGEVQHLNRADGGREP
ncbi:MAG: winged helix-turn-helix transcriptional regulator [Proteobacteria bacterium]|nr:winged helix-turn-helix transcriptional regulator [Pseudomonadota bacterium]